MCTIVLMRGGRALPLVVAANRDERYARHTAPPRELAPGIVGGVDELGGGTWLGVRRNGFFAAVTNQRTFTPPDPGRRSRGQLVLDLLSAGSTAQAGAYLDRLDARAYNPFNLVYGDGASVAVAYGREEAAVERAFVPEGVHVLSNDRLDSPAFPKIAGARAAAGALIGAPWPEQAEGLRALLADHTLPAIEQVPEPPPGSVMNRELVRLLHATCIHTPFYGTRSATLLALVPGGVAHYSYADGPPCRTEFREVQR